MRTRLSGWQIKGLQANGGDQMKYIQLTYTTPAHIPNDIITYSIPFPEGVDGMVIKTIRIESEQNIAFTIDLMDGNTTRPIYQSLEELKFQYDQVDIPYKPTERALFVRLHNKGSVATKFAIDIRGVEVK